MSRYSRQIILSEIGLSGQSKLGSGSILIIGCGGLGSPTALYATSLGIGHIGIIDDDIIELSNLQRQILFCNNDIGISKVEKAKDFLESYNPEIKVSCYDKHASYSFLSSIVGDYNLVIDTTDNFRTRFTVNKVCIEQKKNLISSAVSRFQGNIAHFPLSQDNSCCYSCYHPHNINSVNDRSCHNQGIVGYNCCLISSITVSEISNYFLQSKPNLESKILTYNLKNYRQIISNISKNPNCSACNQINKQSK